MVGRWGRGLARLVGALLVGLSALATGQVPATGNAVRITFFNVGQGDAALITSPTGRRTLIDAGPIGAHVAARLKKMGVDTIDLVIASHNHADHVGGMAAVLESIVVRRYMDNALPQPTATYERVVRALERRSVEVLEPTARRIGIGGGAELRVLPISREAQTQNDRSIGVVVSFGKASALFTGDAESLERTYWMASESLAPIQLLKVSHHGSGNGTDAKFLGMTQPCAAVISVGTPNGFGHPSPAVLSQLRMQRTRVYRTDREGEVRALLTADGRLRMMTSRLTEEPCGLRK